MKLTREVTKVTHDNGSLVYRRLQTLPLGVKIRELSAVMKSGALGVRQHSIKMDYNGKTIVEQLIQSDQKLVQHFDPPLTVARGQAEFKVVCTGFDPETPVTATVTLDFSIALFG